MHLRLDSNNAQSPNRAQKRTLLDGVVNDQTDPPRAFVRRLNLSYSPKQANRVRQLQLGDCASVPSAGGAQWARPLPQRFGIVSSPALRYPKDPSPCEGYGIHSFEAVECEGEALLHPMGMNTT